MARAIRRWDTADRVGARLAWTGATPDVEYWNARWSRQELTRAIADARRHPILRDRFLRYSPAGGRILEAGCGLGQWVAVLRAAGRCVIGLDYDVSTLHQTHATPGYRTLPLLGGDVRQFPFGDETFDSCISLGVAEHFIDGPLPMLREAHRVLRSGGYLLISVPYFSPFRRTRARLGAYRPVRADELAATAFHQFAFRPDEFAGFLVTAGFVVRERVPFAPAVALREEFIARRATSRKAIRPDTGTHSVTGKRVVPRTLARAVLRSFPARWSAGHMILFVAERRAISPPRTAHERAVSG